MARTSRRNPPTRRLIPSTRGSWALLSPFLMTWHVSGSNLGGYPELEGSLGHPLPGGYHLLNRAEPLGQRLLLSVQEGDWRVPEAAPMAVPHVQENLVRELPEEEGRKVVQEAGLPGLQDPDAGGRSRKRQEIDGALIRRLCRVSPGHEPSRVLGRFLPPETAPDLLSTPSGRLMYQDSSFVSAAPRSLLCFLRSFLRHS